MGKQLYSMFPLLRAAEEKSVMGHGAALGAFNVNFYAQAEGILDGLKKTEAPGIIQASRGACKFQGGPDKIQYMVMKALENCSDVTPVALHLDHGTVDAAQECIDGGFSSVMIDASEHPVQENIATTKKVVEFAHEKGVTVEGEYGLLAGVEEDVIHEQTTYADPIMVPYILQESGADCLAISYGTSHGPNKGKTEALDLSIVARSYANLQANGMNFDHFLVSHGSSTVPAEFVALINEYGGNISGASGVPEYMIIRAICNGMRKVNIDTDLRLSMTGNVRKWISENPDKVGKSDLVTTISDVLSGKLVAYDKNGDVVPAAGITDPRSWLKPIAEQTPDVLRNHYEDTNDDVFIEMMQVVSRTVCEHVSSLTRVFGCAGLAEMVDTSMTLEAMAEEYKCCC